ncbi:hypothetical protein ASPZODRAFT_146311 [Penicilliopsis zonata CBS 506.65]|uniref:Uncharacterized protein n=1 Tax=Penicilliopsis zonata CBS 506.65 TaxID=1073090 RepID=A0A1L9S836_9EURO|nr:hypothetical protein ASPZODRAFT_146311 [Penicilliopsis zonata CBS 506.65]OJJ43300.1 hypothetical protein ASPZODRAFT_146311 [Penicilliopsis zonata CBS 506.65]
MYSRGCRIAIDDLALSTPPQTFGRIPRSDHGRRRRRRRGICADGVFRHWVWLGGEDGSGDVLKKVCCLGYINRLDYSPIKARLAFILIGACRTPRLLNPSMNGVLRTEYGVTGEPSLPNLGKDGGATMRIPVLRSEYGTLSRENPRIDATIELAETPEIGIPLR